jgi:ABC-2 type transport system ATP-binding protein
VPALFSFFDNRPAVTHSLRLPYRGPMQLDISGLSKTYANGVRALDGVSLTIPTGMFGLLGPNGAGKSTLMRTIATLQLPDAGTVRFGDIDVLAEPARLRAVLGYLPQEFGLYPNETAESVLDHFARLKGVVDSGDRRALVGALLQQTNLEDARSKKVGGFSGGMKQRLGIAIALAGKPQLLIVDEPTAGLDPVERHRFLNLLAEIGEGVVVILSTHIVEDVRELCSQMAIIDRGRVVLSGDPGRVLEGVRGRVWKKTVEKEQVDRIRESHELISVRLVAGRPVVHVYSEQEPGDGFAPVEAGLEDVYFHTLNNRVVAA